MEAAFPNTLRLHLRNVIGRSEMLWVLLVPLLQVGEVLTCGEGATVIPDVLHRPCPGLLLPCHLLWGLLRASAEPCLVVPLVIVLVHDRLGEAQGQRCILELLLSPVLAE